MSGTWESQSGATEIDRNRAGKRVVSAWKPDVKARGNHFPIANAQMVSQFKSHAVNRINVLRLCILGENFRGSVIGQHSVPLQWV